MAVAREELLQLLVRSVVAGKLDERWALSGMRALAAPDAVEPSGITVAELWRALQDQGDPALGALREHLLGQRLAHARAYRELARSGQGVPSELAAELQDLPLAEMRPEEPVRSTPLAT